MPENPQTEDVRRRITPVLRRHRVARAGLFGSVVRGELGPSSDIDILVELPPEQSLLDLVALKRDLETVLGRKADVVEYSALHPQLRERIPSLWSSHEARPALVPPGHPRQHRED